MDKVQYSPFVAAARRVIMDTGKNITMEETFRLLFSNGILDENGEPTEKAIDEGYVGKEPQSLAEFQAQYPIFRNISSDHFRMTPEGLGIDETGMKIAAQRVADDPNFDPKARRLARIFLAVCGDPDD